MCHLSILLSLKTIQRNVLFGCTNKNSTETVAQTSVLNKTCAAGSSGPKNSMGIMIPGMEILDMSSQHNNYIATSTSSVEPTGHWDVTAEMQRV